MRNRSIALSALVLFAFFGIVSMAYAAAPPDSPAVMQNVTFESSNSTDTLQVFTSYDPMNSHNATPPTWGRVTGTQATGSHGFWCAGSTAGVVTSYPAGTRGQAVLWIPDASQYYSSSVQFSYIEPSLGNLDANASYSPFLVNWASPDATSSTPGFGFQEDLPTVATWTSRTYERGGFTQPPLTAGYLRFQFTSDPTQPVPGVGPTLDDIKVTGYEFGPVNSLHALRQHGSLTNVDLTWAKPSARGASTEDTRTIYYRVWRNDLAANTWTELTAGGAISANTLTDTGGADTAKQYRYAVQAYDSPANTSQWGKLATPALVGTAQPHFLSLSGSPLTVSYGGASHFSAQLVDEVGATLASATVAVQRKVGSQGWTPLVATVHEDSPGSYSADVTSQVNAAYRFNCSIAGSVPSNSVAVIAAGYLTTPSTPSKVTHNKTFKVKGSANRVPGVTRYVVLKAYHKETKKVGGKKKTVWVYRSSAKAAVASGEGVGTYSASFKVKYTGSWRIYASLADAYNPARTTGYRSFTAK